MEIFSGETRLDAPIGSRNPEDSLAKIGVDTLNVNGHLLANSAIQAKADLSNVVLDDCRSTFYYLLCHLYSDYLNLQHINVTIFSSISYFSVVYLDQLLGAVRTQKLVETFML